MRNRAPSLALLLAVVGHGGALAQPQEALAPAAPPVPQYQVEILIFANNEFDPSEERFSQELPAAPGGQDQTLREAPIFDDSNFGPLATAPDATATLPGSATALADSPAVAAPTDDTEFRFRLLRPEELQLNAEYRRLQNLAAYRPLLHAGWIQQGLPEAQSRPFDLALLGALNPRGSVRVHLSRFLNVTLDLTYQDSLSAASEVSPAFGSEPSELTIAPRYRLATQRQTRSGELHYFDHPAFGVLVRVTPVPTEATSPLPGRRPAA